MQISHALIGWGKRRQPVSFQCQEMLRSWADCALPHSVPPGRGPELPEQGGCGPCGTVCGVSAPPFKRLILKLGWRKSWLNFKNTFRLSIVGKKMAILSQRPFLWQSAGDRVPTQSGEPHRWRQVCLSRLEAVLIKPVAFTSSLFTISPRDECYFLPMKRLMLRLSHLLNNPDLVKFLSWDLSLDLLGRKASRVLRWHALFWHHDSVLLVSLSLIFFLCISFFPFLSMTYATMASGDIFGFYWILDIDIQKRRNRWLTPG